jgi:hypothetical protein
MECHFSLGAHSVYQSGMITLVHGTWPGGFFAKWLNIVRPFVGLKPKLLWFQSESPFREDPKRSLTFRENLELSLEAASLDCEIRSFDWSGANSVFARDGAAQKLARVLKEDLKPSNITPIVIAHSHGGNVALRAMTHLGADANRIRLVTLATPFLKVFVRAEAGGGVVLFLLLLAAISGILIPITMMLTALVLSVVNAGNGWLYLAFPLPILIAFFVTPRLMSIFIDGWNDRPRKIQQAADYETRSPSAPRTLVIRGVDDEAVLSLAAGAIASRLSYVLLFSVVPKAYVTVFLLSVILSGLGVGAVDWLLRPLIVLLCLGALALLILPGIFKSVFGREFVIGAMRCDIAADSVPDTSERVEAITLAPETGRPRHQIYEHPRCVSEIVDWLRRGR